MISSLDLLSEMKKIKRDKKPSMDLPQTIGGVSGESSIVELFKECYSSLYNSASTEAQVEKLKLLLNREITEFNLSEVNKINGKITKLAAMKMKPDKLDVSASFSSDAILNAPDSFFELLAIIFRSWLSH